MADRVAQKDDGSFVRLDQRTGEWVPASEQELDVIEAGALGQAASFGEGLLPVVGIAEALGLVEEGRSEALSTINPRSEQAGFIAGMGGLGLALLKNGGKLALKAGVTGKGKQAVDAAINVPRNFKQAVRGQDPGIVRGAAGGLAGAGQAVVEGSQILRGAFPKAAPNIQKQLATNIAATRGVGLAPQVGGKVPRATVATAKKRVDDLYDAGVADPEAFVDVSGFQSLADDIKMPSSLEQILFGDLLKGGVMKPKQVLNRRKAIAKINAETDDDIMRDASRKVLDLMDSVIDGDDAFDSAILAQADEEWRFLKALEAGVGKGEEISNSRWTNALAKYFPKEFGRADFATKSMRDRVLSEQGQESISAALRIEAAQGVKTPQEGLTAIDFLLGGGALLGGTGAGIFRE